ncbi:MAG: phospholipid carrier-dependent glycosyltransferase [Actinomycetota bacterium]
MTAAGRSWTTIGVPAVVLAIAAVVRLWGLPSPDAPYWDEQYYVFDAEVYLGGGIGQPVGNPPAVKIADEGTWIHPPLGKWVIALLGVGPLGLRSLGWRLPSAIFGIAGVGLLYLLAYRLWRSVWWAGLASLLLALDGLHIVQSRMAMLDIFLTTFITAALLFLVLDRERMDTGDRPHGWPRVEVVFGSPYRMWAGVFLGAAVATKWSGAFALLFGTILCTSWVFTGDRRGGRTRLAAAGTLAASFALVPLGVYLLSYGAFFYQHGLAIHDFITLQIRMLEYQRHHLRIQPENSQPWTWPLLLHPIQYFRSSAGGAVTAIVALGNPALWWGFLALLPVGLFTVARRPTWRDALIFGGYAAMFLPWLLVPRSQFLFYMLPAVPFMCLGVTAILHGLSPGPARVAGIASAGIAGVVASAYLPAWTGWVTSVGWLRELRLLRSWPL